MGGVNEGIDWDGIEDALIKKWYYVIKILGVVAHGQYPYFTFEEMYYQITQDKEFKPKEE
jgi:hypothetical protein